MSPLSTLSPLSLLWLCLRHSAVQARLKGCTDISVAPQELLDMAQCHTVSECINLDAADEYIHLLTTELAEAYARAHRLRQPMTSLQEDTDNVMALAEYVRDIFEHVDSHYFQPLTGHNPAIYKGLERLLQDHSCHYITARLERLLYRHYLQTYQDGRLMSFLQHAFDTVVTATTVSYFASPLRSVWDMQVFRDDDYVDVGMLVMDVLVYQRFDILKWLYHSYPQPKIRRKFKQAVRDLDTFMPVDMANDDISTYYAAVDMATRLIV